MKAKALIQLLQAIDPEMEVMLPTPRDGEAIQFDNAARLKLTSSPTHDFAFLHGVDDASTHCFQWSGWGK